MLTVLFLGLISILPVLTIFIGALACQQVIESVGDRTIITLLLFSITIVSAIAAMSTIYVIVQAYGS